MHLAYFLQSGHAIPRYGSASSPVRAHVAPLKGSRCVEVKGPANYPVQANGRQRIYVLPFTGDGAAPKNHRRGLSWRKPETPPARQPLDGTARTPSEAPHLCLTPRRRASPTGRGGLPPNPSTPGPTQRVDPPNPAPTGAADRDRPRRGLLRPGRGGRPDLLRRVLARARLLPARLGLRPLAGHPVQ